MALERFFICLYCLLQFSCSGEAQKKINGVSFVAAREEVGQEQVEEILKIHANSASVMPFGFIRDLSTPQIVFDSERQWFGETTKGAKQYIEMLKKNGIAVMVKPQIWVSRGAFTGTIIMATEAEWKELESEYEQFILAYAKLAQETKAPIFCIGTELEQFVANRPKYWSNLIKKIRKVYRGKLTYAANWDEYKRTPFWEQLDYIGIDAYFPLSEAKTPSVDELREAWRPWKEKIKLLSQTLNRPVLFTEFGYRSMDYTAKKPWLVDRTEERVNLEAQVNSKEAIFSEFWSEDWFAGGYVWKWFIHHERSGGASDNRFTPQNKPAQQTLAKHFEMHAH
jgi:ppGpp synthetase/RelA/SpoT-type nucleotidyltranferase